MKRRDLAGKTGTTNEQRDAWFSGFNSKIVATAWVGFDQSQPLGDKETGARAALPMWMDFMSVALAGMEESTLQQPENLVTVRIDPETGRAASSTDDAAVFETFRSDRVPEQSEDEPALGGYGDGAAAGTPAQLF